MLETIYRFATDNEKHIEKIIDDDPVLINHIVLPKGGGLPEHDSNSNVYLFLIRGEMTLKLNDQEPQRYTGGQIVIIPYKTRMNLNNLAEEVLEFFVVKAPNPRHYKEG